MKTPNPVDLLFADMDKLSPGDDSVSLYVLRSLPQHRFEVVVDAGCGADVKPWCWRASFEHQFRQLIRISHS